MHLPWRARFFSRKSYLKRSLSYRRTDVSGSLIKGPDSRYEARTWPELQRLASNVPEAHIHFQQTVLHNRTKDVGTTTGNWFAELLKTEPWWKDVVPDVNHSLLPRPYRKPPLQPLPFPIIP